jgi:hypothetical protein
MCTPPPRPHTRHTRHTRHSPPPSRYARAAYGYPMAAGHMTNLSSALKLLATLPLFDPITGEEAAQGGGRSGSGWVGGHAGVAYFQQGALMSCPLLAPALMLPASYCTHRHTPCWKHLGAHEPAVG